MSVTLQSLSSGEPVPAKVPELEAELSALWRSAAGDSGDAITRACALTLLVYTESQKAAREVSNLVVELTLQNPCRAIVMIAEPDAKPSELKAWISAHCHLPEAGGKQVCCDEITIEARGDAVENLGSVVLPLTVSGLPVVLWWKAGSFAPGKHFEQILRVANRVLVDSARFHDPLADLAELSSQVRRLIGKLEVTDLNWARITPWRELIAQCFDSPERQPHLHRITEVRIEYEEHSPRGVAQQVQAFLLAAWLAARLKWRPRPESAAGKKPATDFLFKSGERAVKIHCGARSFEGGGAGLCFSISMKSDGDSPAAFSLERGCDGKVVTTRAEIPSKPAVQRKVRLEVLGEVDLINAELRFSGHDRIYAETMEMLAAMTGGE